MAMTSSNIKEPAGIKTLIEDFRAELVRRFQLQGLTASRCGEETVLGSIARRYAETFFASPEARDKYPDPETLCFQAALHCYHAGLCVALYELTEEDFEVSERTFDILTNMDTVFFSGLLLSRWNVKKRCASYKTDLMAESIYKVMRAVIAKSGDTINDFPGLTEALALIFLAGVVTDVTKLEEPSIDLSGLSGIE